MNQNKNSRYDPEAQTQAFPPATSPTPPPASLEDTRPNSVPSNLPATQPMLVEYSPPAIDPPDPIAAYQPIRIPRQKRRPRKARSLGCALLPLFILLCLLAYLLAPLPTQVLLLGLDRAPEGSDASRTDTMILMAVNPLQPRVTMLSIPRDLWVSIPNVGENRINTAHFFAEASDPGSGPRAALETVRQNFGVPTRYYVRVRFDGFVDIVNAMGGVTITLEQPTGLLEAGTHPLDGTQALAFVRDRSGADDFFRMAHAQILLKAAVQKWLNPLTWVRLPAVAAALSRSLDTNLPFWQWPRIAVAVARSLLGGLDARTLPREAVTPFVTNEGAAVLLPNWDLIRPLVDELF